MLGFQCPRCGSRAIALVASESLTYKCTSCGHVWSPPVAGTGYVAVGKALVHWTELKRVMEDALNDAKNAFLRGGGCQELMESLSNKYSDYLTLRELAKAAVLGAKRAMGEVKYRDRRLYEAILRELEKCRELLH